MTPTPSHDGSKQLVLVLWLIGLDLCPSTVCRWQCADQTDCLCDGPLWKTAAERILKDHGRDIRHQPDTCLYVWVCAGMWRAPLKNRWKALTLPVILAFCTLLHILKYAMQTHSHIDCSLHLLAVVAWCPVISVHDSHCVLSNPVYHSHTL